VAPCRLIAEISEKGGVSDVRGWGRGKLRGVVRMGEVTSCRLVFWEMGAAVEMGILVKI
jgi:hypothetical protein